MRHKKSFCYCLLLTLYVWVLQLWLLLFLIVGWFLFVGYFFISDPLIPLFIDFLCLFLSLCQTGAIGGNQWRGAEGERWETAQE